MAISFAIPDLDLYCHAFHTRSEPKKAGRYSRRRYKDGSPRLGASVNISR